MVRFHVSTRIARTCFGEPFAPYGLAVGEPVALTCMFSYADIVEIAQITRGLEA
jgi:hypothetical protein